MAFPTYNVSRLWSLNDREKWIANFKDVGDASFFCRTYIATVNCDRAAGYPVLKLYKRMVSREREYEPELLYTYYPNAYDNEKVEELEVANVRH